MSRLIDADKLSKYVYHEAFETDTDMQKWDSGCWIRYKMIKNAIEKAPTVDAVEVVRCKDCIYHNSKSHNCGHPKMGFGLMNVNENDFCPHGERKTDNEKET